MSTNGRLRTCGQIPDSATDMDTLGQLLDFVSLTRDGWLLDTSGLFATCAFANDDVGTDAGLYAQSIISHLPSDGLKAMAGHVIGQPSRENVRSLAKQARLWLFTADARKADRKNIAVVRDVMERADFYSAAFGDVTLCERSAMHLYGHAVREKNAVLHTRLVAVALGLLARAQDIETGTRQILPMQSPNWLRQAMDRLHITSARFDQHEHARKTLKLGQGTAVTIEDRLSGQPDADEPNAPDVNVQAERDVLLSIAQSPPVIAAPQPPTLVVLRSLSHLPEARSSNHSNPRLEFGPIAGVDLPLAETPDLQAVSRSLIAEMPWAEDVITTLLMDSVGSAAARVRNSLLVGKPGSGKTRLARRLGELLGMQPTLIPAAGVADSTFGGTSRSYATGRASTALQCVRRTGIANPMLIIDEIDKAASGNYNGRLVDVLVPFLELESSQFLHDPYVETAADLSQLVWVATANELSGTPGPLLDRFRVLDVPQPRKQDLPVVARTIMAEIRTARGEDKVWCPDLDRDELDLLVREWKGGSLRPLRRMIETILSGRMVFASRH